MIYEKVSTFSNGIAIVQRDGEIFAVNHRNQRTALLREQVGAEDFGNLTQNRVAILMQNGKWRRANASFTMDPVEFDEIGAYSEGFAAVKHNGRWGVIDLAGEVLIPAVHEDIIRDSLGRSYGQGVVFIRSGGEVHMYSGGARVEGISFEDARPFSNEGPAAVKSGGKWGFIDRTGRMVIEPQYEDAYSFSGHLAAVKYGDYWGYLALTGDFGIEPQFHQARSFRNGSAPVLTDRGWQIIMLTEFATGSGGLL
jgi:hypothetical protein